MPAVADPRFAERLKSLRVRAGLSVRKLAEQAMYAKTYISELENGRKPPTPEVARRLDEALSAGGDLVALVDSPQVLSPDDDDRLLYLARHPRRLDTATVGILSDLLAAQRRLEDVAGAAAVHPAVEAQLVLVEALVADARGRLRPEMVDVAAQWGQFLGWLNSQLRNPAAARSWYGRALEWATETGDANMIATALNLRGHLAWQAGQPGAMIGLSQAAARQNASPGVTALAVQQVARGHAVLGEARDVDRLLDTAQELAANRAGEPPWIYFFNGTYLRLQRGLAYRLLGRYPQAVEHLSAGLAGVPAEQGYSEWVGYYAYQLAVTHALAGDRQAAAAILAEVSALATATSSPRLGRAVARALQRFGLSADM